MTSDLIAVTQNLPDCAPVVVAVVVVVEVVVVVDLCSGENGFWCLK